MNLKKTRLHHKFWIQEVGVGSPGNLKRVLPILRPDIGVVTTIGQDHYRSYRTLEATAAEKGLLIESLPKTGVAVLNADDPHVLSMAERSHAKVLTYGRTAAADVRATDIRSVWPERLSATVIYRGESVHIETGLFGDLLLTSVLAAVAGAVAAGVDLQQCARSLKNIETYNRRMSIHTSPEGAWYINDSFKAPYWSIEKAVTPLKDAQAPRKTLVFGSFSDTTGASSPKYRAMARLGLELADRVIFVGKNAVRIKKMLSAELEGRLFMIDSVEAARRLLSEDVVENELVLIKSNKREHLERLIYSQSAELKCWKETCPKIIDCKQCEESGLMAGD